MGLIRDSDVSQCRAIVELFTKWISNNNLLLNVNKTKELVTDFRMKPPSFRLFYINDTAAESMEHMKFLGVDVMHGLSLHTTSLLKKG